MATRWGAPAKLAATPGKPHLQSIQEVVTDAIKVGSLVLATTSPMEDWFKCIVRLTPSNDAFVLSWRDWPHEPDITRRRDELALLLALNRTAEAEPIQACRITKTDR